MPVLSNLSCGPIRLSELLRQLDKGKAMAKGKAKAKEKFTRADLPKGFVEYPGVDIYISKYLIGFICFICFICFIRFICFKFLELC